MTKMTKSARDPQSANRNQITEGLTLPFSHSPPSLRHFVTQGLLPSVVVLGCGFSLPVRGFVRTKNKNKMYI